MLDKIEYLIKRHEEIERLLGDPTITGDNKKYRELMREYSQLGELKEVYNRREKTAHELASARHMVEAEKDPEMKEMAREEILGLEAALEAQEEELKLLLIPKDPNDSKNIIMEIRAGTGGDEAALFAADLFRMYSRFAEGRGWKIEIMDSNESELGGFKEIIFLMAGKDVYADMRYESGGHRVQRVPITEANGRIQTSAATVAVLPEAEETEIDIQDKDIRVDVFRSSGPGGQSVNTTDSAVRITHIPTGIVVQCQDEKSQIKNKSKALTVLRSRILEQEETKKALERSADRKSQVGSGDRSERIRTYNFPQNRLTDHRINLTLYSLDRVMEGDLKELIKALKVNAQQERMMEEAQR